MQVMTVVFTVPANTLSDNLIDGEIGEFLAGPSTVNIYGRAAAVGLELTFQVGSEVFMQNQEIGSQAGFPTRNENALVQGVGGFGERIEVRGRNTTGAGILVQLLIEVNRVA